MTAQTDELEIGNEASFSRTIGECDVYAFAGLTGDNAPLHTDEAAMRRSAYGRRVAHGAMLVGFMSRAATLLAQRATAGTRDETLVNLGYDRIRFVAPVFIGDTITVTCRIIEVDAAKRRAHADLTVTNEHGRTVAVARNLLQGVVNTRELRL
jgi:acyl dehydratase